MKPAVILLSGGLDSATVLAIARAAGFDPYALSFRYGQRHAVELAAARQVAAAVGVTEHVIIEIDLRRFGGSALTSDLPVPKDRSLAAISDGIPSTYVPARNTLFLAYALAWAETLSATDIFIGVNALDYSGYPDCRPEFIAAFEQLANLGTAAGVGAAARAAAGADDPGRLRIHAPLIDLTKAGIIQRGLALGLDYGLTSSCYDPNPHGRPCGRCDACLLRAKGFAEVGQPDPLLARFASAAG
ncbi:MAG: 7-cyano-7-deazaguanine synthase QueC [Chromatiaceae bacterium]|nr:MAG: 7-cyano-7-deazaguanine synthase QueC [Chromatiaceae bacterium]